MIKVYGCPDCLRLEIGSMRRGMVCPVCRGEMTRLSLTFLEYTEMTGEERTAYALKWASELRGKPVQAEDSSEIFKVLNTD